MTKLYEWRLYTRPRCIWPYQTRYSSHIHLAKQEHVFGYKISAFNLIPQALSFMKKLILLLVQNKPAVLQHLLPLSVLVISKISNCSLIKSTILLNVTWLSPMHHQHHAIIGYQLHHSSFPSSSSLIQFMLSLSFIIGMVLWRGVKKMDWECCWCIQCFEESCNCWWWYKLLVLVKEWVVLCLCNHASTASVRIPLIEKVHGCQVVKLVCVHVIWSATTLC